MGSIYPAVSEICVPQSLDPICGKFDKFLDPGQAHKVKMGKWPWQCTTTGLDNSTELRMEKIHQAVTEIWVPQIWQPPARPPEPWRQYPSNPEGWGVKIQIRDFALLTKIFSLWPGTSGIFSSFCIISDRCLSNITRNVDSFNESRMMIKVKKIVYRYPCTRLLPRFARMESSMNS